MKKCSSCGERVVEALLRDEIRVGGVRFDGSIPGWRCDGCGEGFYDSAGLREFELAAAVQLLEKGAHEPDVLRHARKALGHTAAELAELLDVRAETLSRWETGERAAERRAVALLAGLVTDAMRGTSETAERVRALRAPATPPRRVDLDAYRETLRAQLQSAAERAARGAERVTALREDAAGRRGARR